MKRSDEERPDSLLDKQKDPALAGLFVLWIHPLPFLPFFSLFIRQYYRLNGFLVKRLHFYLKCYKFGYSIFFKYELIL